jgi:hypothetical protein
MPPAGSVEVNSPAVAALPSVLEKGPVPIGLRASPRLAVRQARFCASVMVVAPEDS